MSSGTCGTNVDPKLTAPQPNVGLGQQYELLDWLQHITFPRESKFEDATYAEKVYRSVVDRFLRLGTTTACKYASLHLEGMCAETRAGLTLQHPRPLCASAMNMGYVHSLVDARWTGTRRTGTRSPTPIPPVNTRASSSLTPRSSAGRLKRPRCSRFSPRDLPSAVRRSSCMV